MNRIPSRAVVFDAVGTLITVATGVGEIYQAAGRQHGSSLGIDEIVSRFHLARNREFSAREPNLELDERATGETTPVQWTSMSVEKQPTDEDVHRTSDSRTSNADQRQKWFRIVSSVFDDVPKPDPLFEQLWNTFSEPSTWSVFPEVEDVLGSLADAGFTIAMGSNFDSRLHRIVGGLPALKSVQHVFTSGELGHAKPSPHFYRRIESGLSLPAERCIMIGDDLECDQRGAAGAGWAAWLVDRNRTDVDLKETTLSDLSRLPELLIG